MKKFFNYLFVALIVCGLSFGSAWLAVKHFQQPAAVVMTGDSTQYVLPQAYAKFASLPQAGETDFTVAAELSVNAVVHVKTTYTSQRQQYSADPFFEFFFGRPQQGREVPQQRASGSGVIISPDGYIVTNNHVINKADEIEVVLNDKRSFTAQLVGTDPNTDIALLKIEATDLPVIVMGNSDDIRVGEWVLAVGNPFNLTSTVTAGIVSAKARNINILDTDMKIESFIQTDAAVNPGNSGGALVNTRGELIGINTAIASQTGSYTGYSFAVPTSIVQKVVSDIRTYGVVQRAILGVQIQEITAELQKEKNIPTLKGAYIANVIKDGAAEKAGMKTGDVVTAIDNAVISSATDLQELIARHRPGDKITITVLRNNKPLNLTAELTNKHGDTGIVKRSEGIVVLGAEFTEINQATKQKLGLESGLQVTSVKNGKFQKAGIEKGFIVLKVNNRPIRTEDDLQEVVDAALQASDKDKVLFIAGVNQRGRVEYYAINLNE